MHEEVRFDFHKRISSPRLTSFAGQGLPERMRSTAFAFLGLTAAAGLAFVAIFAQLSFPLLSPAPMPSDPSQANAVAQAVAVERAPRAVPAREQRAPVSPSRLDREAHLAPDLTKPNAVETPAPALSSDPAPDGGGVNVEQTVPPNPEPSPAPSTPSRSPAPRPPSPPAPTPAPAPGPVPVASPPPETAPPALPVGPGNSSSAAAAAHASSQGIEASSGKGLGHGK